MFISYPYQVLGITSCGIRVLGVFLCVELFFGTFNSRTLHSCLYLSVLGLFLDISCCFLVLNTFCLCHFDFLISRSFVKVMFLHKCYQFYVVLLLIILVS